MAAPDGSVLAILLEDAPLFFNDATLALARLCSELGATLRSVDLVYTPPAELLCVLHLAPGSVNERVLTIVDRAAANGHMRVLDTAGLSPVERVKAMRVAEQRLSIREANITDLPAALARYRKFVMLESQALMRPPDSALSLSLFYPSGDQFLSRFHKDNSLFIESEGLLPIGQELKLSIATGTGQGPIVLSSRVTAGQDSVQAAQSGERPGFRVSFLLPPNERVLFESFLIALHRGTAWPDRSGRRHERFNIQLKVVYHDGKELRREYTENLSRGGMFMVSFDPPPKDAELDLQLYAPGREEPISLVGRVVHSVSAEEAATRNRQSGAGIIFTEPAEGVALRIEDFLGALAVTGTRRALIADDDKFFRSVLGNTLRLGGFEVAEAEDGPTAAQLLVAPNAPDVLVIDLYMPGMTGVEVLAQTRTRRDPKMAVMVITGATLSDHEQHTLARLGADAVVPKSTAGELLLEHIEVALAKRSAGGETK